MKLLKLESDSPATHPDAQGIMAFWKFMLVFAALASGILLTGVLYYRQYEQRFRAEIEQKISAIGALKVDELTHWRRERLGDANTFYHNRTFIALMRRVFEDPADAEAKGLLIDWVGKYFIHFDYDQFRLMDAQGITRLSTPGGLNPASSNTVQVSSEVLRSGRIVIQDFYRNERDHRIYLAVHIPILDESDADRPLGVLVLRADPEKYLYPLIKHWPTPSATGETLLVRRDGNDVLFLNDLRFQTNAALNLRVPLDRVTMPAVCAALDREGFMDGLDYRGQQVVAVARSIPDSPWRLVARIDKKEVYEPLRRQLWQLAATIGFMLFGAAALTGLIWRQLRLRFYKQEAQSAKKLKESNSLLSLFVLHSPIYTFIKSVTPTESRVVMASENFKEMIGIDGPGMAGKTMKEIFPADLAAKITRDDWACVEKGKMLQIDETLNGRIYTTIKFPIQMEGQSFLAGYTIDITDRKMTEEEIRQSRAAALNIMEDAIAERDRAEKAVAALEESKSLMEAVVENAPLMVYLKTAADLRFVLFNRAGEEITGYDRKDVLGKTDEDFFSPEKTAHFMAGEREVLEGKIEILDDVAQEPLATVRKGARWLHTKKICIRGNDGQAKYLLGVAEDITERKLATEALEQANTGLKLAMQDLQKAQKQIVQQERLSALGQMASGIAHDFNNILMPIIGCSELLISDPDALNDREEAKHMLEMIHSAGQDARHIVRRLRTVYKVNYGSEYELQDLAKIVESALSITMPKWKEEMRAKGSLIEIVTDFQPVPLINGNASELRELLTNLIFNSTDAMPKGGIMTFRLHSEDNTYVLLEMTDTGYGMDEATLAQCMEPFFSTKGPQGSGLGLAMVHGIVERHGGAINITSKPGAGTTVRLRFSVPVEASVTELAPEKNAAPLSPMRVLIVDDEERAIKLLIRIMKTDNHQVETADNGRQGLDALHKGQFDLIITDRAMPVMGGDEFAVEAQKIQPGIPIIMLTGFGEIMKDSGDLPPGVSRVMSKPITRKDLRSVMISVMRSKSV